MGIHLEKLGEIIGWVNQIGFKNVQKPYLKDHQLKDVVNKWKLI